MAGKARKSVPLADLRARLMTLRSARRDASEAISVMANTARYLEGARAVQSGGAQVAIVLSTPMAEQLSRAFETADYCLVRTRDELDLWIAEVEALIDGAAGKPEPQKARTMQEALSMGRDFGFLEVGEHPVNSRK